MQPVSPDSWAAEIERSIEEASSPPATAAAAGGTARPSVAPTDDDDTPTWLRNAASVLQAEPAAEDTAPYELLRFLAKGSYGKVYAARVRGGAEDAPTVAVKVVPLDVDSRPTTDVTREVERLQACDHPHVLRCITSSVQRQQLWIVTEFCEGGRYAERPSASSVCLLLTRSCPIAACSTRCVRSARRSARRRSPRRSPARCARSITYTARFGCCTAAG